MLFIITIKICNNITIYINYAILNSQMLFTIESC